MACKVCEHKDRRAIERAAKASPSLEGLVAVCAQYDVTRAALERHLAKCPAAKRRRGAQEAPDEAPPDSGRRAVADVQEEAPLPPPRELAAPDEELRRRAKLLTRQLEHMIESRSEPRHISNVANALAVVDKLMLARERGARLIYEHPDFEGMVMDLVAAVVAELGPNAPEGLEGRVAERFEELQAERASSGVVERRAA